MHQHFTITNSYSMDIVIKICATLVTFLMFLFASAWHMTRKTYKYPKFVESKRLIKDIKNLVNREFLNSCYKAGCDGNRPKHIRLVSSKIFQNKLAIVVNDLDWMMNNKSNFIFTVPFSLAPKNLKNSWKGLLFSRDSNEKDVLLCLIIKGFESLDWEVLQKSLNFGLRKSKLNDEIFSLEITALLVAFESIFGYDVDDTKLDKKLIFINEISVIINEFASFFYTGKSLTDGFEVTEILDKIEELLYPVIESAIYHCDSQYDEERSSEDVNPNLLSQIAFLRHQLKEENINSHNVTVEDVSHCLFEHLFILSELLKESLVGVRRLLVSAPDIIDVVRKELATEVTLGQSKQRILTEYNLESCNGLVYTKSTTQELLRLLSLGSQFDLCLAERDGLLGHYDMREYSVILFNHFAFCRNKCFGVTDTVDAEFFRPGRFVKHDFEEKKYVFFNTCHLVTFQDQYNFVAIPRNFVCRLLLLLLINCVSPEYEIELNPLALDGDYNQLELLYDINKKIPWTADDLVDDN